MFLLIILQLPENTNYFQYCQRSINTGLWCTNEPFTIQSRHWRWVRGCFLLMDECQRYWENLSVYWVFHVWEWLLKYECFSEEMPNHLDTFSRPWLFINSSPKYLSRYYCQIWESCYKYSDTSCLSHYFQFIEHFHFKLCIAELFSIKHPIFIQVWKAHCLAQVRQFPICSNYFKYWIVPAHKHTFVPRLAHGSL